MRGLGGEVLAHHRVSSAGGRRRGAGRGGRGRGRRRAARGETLGCRGALEAGLLRLDDAEAHAMLGGEPRSGRRRGLASA